MPAVARKGDLDTGHDSCSPRPSSEGSPNVYVNGRPAHRQGDGWSPHGCANHASHGSVLAEGSGTVYVNGKPLGRVDDPVACGSKVAEGSGDVYAG